jgi:hypothetical protein
MTCSGGSRNGLSCFSSSDCLGGGFCKSYVCQSFVCQSFVCKSFLCVGSFAASIEGGEAPACVPSFFELLKAEGDLGR